MTHLEQQPTTWISWHENLRLAQFDLMGVAVDNSNGCGIQMGVAVDNSKSLE